MFIHYSNMKDLCICAFLISYTSAAWAQSSISGSVSDPQGQPMVSANVLLLQPNDSSLVKGVVSDINGDFAITQVQQGNYLLSASMIGYTTLFQPLSLNGQHLAVGELVLREDVQQLGEVVVRTSKPPFEQHLDKLVVNVENSILATGGTAMDVLARSPGVTINQQSNNISLAGKQNVLVMINGKLSPLPLDAVMQQLAGISADNIEKIELITSPSAKYDAQGDAGIINIILKKNQEYGTNGSYTLTAGYGRFEKGMGAINLNHRSGKVNLYADYSYNHDHLWQFFSTDRMITYQGQNSYTEINMDREGYRQVHNGRVGMDIEISPNTSLGLVGSGLSNRFEQNATAFSEVSKGQILLNRTDIALNEVNHWSSMMGNMNLRHQFGEHSLSMDVDYLYYDNENPSNYKMEYQSNEGVSSMPDEIALEKTTPIYMWVAKADLEFSLGEAGSLETGLKGIRNRMDNDVVLNQLFQDRWVLSQRFSQSFLLKEDLAAAYVNFYTELGDKTQLQTGIRTEYTRMMIPADSVGKAATFELNFWSLFPTLFLSRKISDQHKVQLSYNRRITRPSYTEIAPFVFFMDPNTYFTGNPALRPTLSNKIQAGYTFDERFIFNLSYSHDRHFIASFQATTEPETNLVYFRSKNLDRFHTWSATASFPLNPTKWWQIQNNLVGSYQQILTNYEGVDLDIRRWIAQVNTVHTFLLPLDMSAELSAFYNSPTQFGIAQFGGTGTVSTALQKSFSEGRSKLSLSIHDIFWTNRFIVKSNSAELNDHQRWDLLFEPRVVRISCSHNFGSQKVKGKGGRSTGSEEERKRMGI